MPTDPGQLLCTYAQFDTGPLADLISDDAWTEDIVTEYLLEGTRMCEDACGRRFVPFTVTETHRAEGIDPDEGGGDANVPMSIQSTLGFSYANAIGGQDLVRHCWLDERAPRYLEMWAYTNVSVSIIRSYGGTQDVPAGQILNGPEPDTGHLWFQLGLYLPVGSRIQVTYTGGYQLAIPASLTRAARFMTASNIVRDLNPGSTDHNPDQLYANAMRVLAPWGADTAAVGKAS